MKKIQACILAATLAMSMSMPAMAAGGSATNTGVSQGEGASNPTTIAVTGTYKKGTGSQEKISVDIAWESMDFTYDAGNAGTWNTTTHTYEGATDGGWRNEQKAIIMKNHSNTGVVASLSFDSAIDGMKGVFSNEYLTLVSADDDAYRANEEGSENTLKAPTKTVKFSIDTTSPAISEDKVLGDISITIKKANVIDRSTLAGDTSTEKINALKQQLQELLNNGITEVTIDFPNADYDEAEKSALWEAIRDALDDSAAPAGSVDLTTIGLLAYENVFANCTKLGRVTMIGNSTIPNAIFEGCTKLTKVVLPKVESIGNYTLSGDTALETIEFSTVITWVGLDWLYDVNTQNVTLTLNASQGDVGEYPTVFGTGGTFGGYTFKEVKGAQ